VFRSTLTWIYVLSRSSLAAKAWVLKSNAEYWWFSLHHQKCSVAKLMPSFPQGSYALSAGHSDAYYKRAQEVWFFESTISFYLSMTPTTLRFAAWLKLICPQSSKPMMFYLLLPLQRQPFVQTRRFRDIWLFKRNKTEFLFVVPKGPSTGNVFWWYDDC